MKTIRFGHLAIAATFSILSACGDKKEPAKNPPGPTPGSERPDAAASKLSPYSAVFIFSLGILVSNFAFNTLLRSSGARPPG